MRKTFLLIGLPIVLLVSIACEPIAYWVGLETGPKVFVGGDSVLYRAKPYMEANLQDTYQTHFAAAPTIVISDFYPFAETANEQGPPDQSVINGGHNNGRNGQTPQEAWAEMVPLLSILDTSDCIHIMTLSARSPYPDVNAWNLEFNALIKSEVAALGDPTVKVVAWDEFVEDYWNNGPWLGDPLFYDGLHPTETGGNYISDLVEASIQSCPV